MQARTGSPTNRSWVLDNINGLLSCWHWLVKNACTTVKAFSEAMLHTNSLYSSTSLCCWSTHSDSLLYTAFLRLIYCWIAQVQRNMGGLFLMCKAIEMLFCTGITYGARKQWKNYCRSQRTNQLASLSFFHFSWFLKKLDTSGYL